MLNNYKNTVKSWNKLYEVETKKGKSSKDKIDIFYKKQKKTIVYKNIK